MACILASATLPWVRAEDPGANPPKVVAIEIEPTNVFDLGESDHHTWAYRLLNVIHRPNLTRKRTVRALLTLQVGDPCTAERVEEAERELRVFKFIQDAWVRAESVEGGGCLLRVTVQDAWSTKLGASFGNEGGSSRYRLRISETNLLGTGQRIDWTRRHNQDRTQSSLMLISPSLFGSHWRSELVYSNNSDGREHKLTITRPFWRLEERWSMEFRARGLEAEERVYVDGEIADYWLRDSTAFYAGYARAPKGLVGDRLFTWKLGIEGDRQDWTLTDPAGNPTRPDLRPIARDLVLAAGELSWQRIDFRRVQRIRSGLRVDDLSLGRELTVGLSVSIPGLSQDTGGRIYLSARQGFEVKPEHYLLLHASQQATRLEGHWINVITTLEGQYYQRLSTKQTLAVLSTWNFGRDVEGTKRTLLGGDTGLRAFRSRAFAGSSSALLTVEHRVFTDRQLTRLFRIGVATFLDLGSAWEDSEGLSASDLHADLGIGLRFLLAPSGSGTTLHVNAAYALDTNALDGEKRWRFSVVSKSGF